MRLHNPSANIQRRNVSSPTSSPSSSAKCSAASVGPNRFCSVPEYFSRMSCSTFRRDFSGFALFVASSCAAVLEPLGSFFAISLPESLRLPVAQLQHLGCVDQPYILYLHSRHHLYSPQFPRTNRCPP